jgi:hypothetical protein
MQVPGPQGIKSALGAEKRGKVAPQGVGILYTIFDGLFNPMPACRKTL